MKLSRLPHSCDGWETVASKSHFANAHLAVATENVRTPSRLSAQSWTVVHRKAAVVIAAFTPDGKMVLIRQERIPIRAAIWEVPAGQIDDKAEIEPAAIQAVALRELREETGYELGERGELVSLGHCFSSPGFTDEHGYFFLARGVISARDGHAHEDTEAILNCQEFTLPEVARMIAENEIRDANTLSICAKLVAGGFVNLEG